MVENAGAYSSHRNAFLVAVVVGGLFYLAGQYIASQPSRIEKESEANREIAVQGHAEVNVQPDVAKITLGVTTGPQASAAAALKKLSETFNAVVAAVEEIDVDKKDIKATNVSLNPVYDYSDGRQMLRGFEASESIEVTIRNLDRTGEVIAQATGQGANQVGGLNFTVDDLEKVQQEAEVAAIKDAREKAESLAKALNVDLGRVKNFNASRSTPPGPMPYFAADVANKAAEITPPEVPSGTNTITADVTITYELR